jgi:hypothetical protein
VAEPVTIDVLANDTDSDNDALTVTGAQANLGLVVVNSDQSLTFTPPSDFSGQIIVNYQITDGRGANAAAQVVVTVRPITTRIDNSGGGVLSIVWLVLLITVAAFRRRDLIVTSRTSFTHESYYEV